MMHRRVVVTALGLALGAGTAMFGGRALAAQAGVIAEVERYLNAIDTLEASFSQIAPNGELSTGTVYIQRPGRLRFDYDPPSQIRLVAPGDWRLVFYDASIQQVNVIPISQTPLGILLDEQIALDTDVEVTGIERAGDEIALTVVRKDAADQGSVTLVFGERPLALRRWSVVDAQGLVTHVLLENVETGGVLDPELFRWRDPKLFGFPD
jgi:outer membrane lipoprotein-sorting protein